jgi:hypothetical protein
VVYQRGFRNASGAFEQHEIIAICVSMKMYITRKGTEGRLNETKLRIINISVTTLTKRQKKKKKNNKQKTNKDIKQQNHFNDGSISISIAPCHDVIQGAFFSHQLI